MTVQPDPGPLSLLAATGFSSGRPKTGSRALASELARGPGLNSQ